MDKIQKAQELADQLLDEAKDAYKGMHDYYKKEAADRQKEYDAKYPKKESIRQVGDDKGALKDEPESIKKSEEDLEDYVSMESDDLLEDEIFSERYLEKDEVDKLHKIRMGLADKHQKQSKHPTIQKYNVFSKTNRMKKKADSRKRDADWDRTWSKAVRGIKEKDSQISNMVNNLQTYLGESETDEKGRTLTTKNLVKLRDIRKNIANKAYNNYKKAPKGNSKKQRSAAADFHDSADAVIRNSHRVIRSSQNEAAPVTGVALAKMRRGIKRNDRNLKLGNSMDPTAKANAKKRKEKIAESEKKKGGWDYIKRDLGRVKGAIGNIFKKGQLNAPKIQKKGVSSSTSLAKKIFSGISKRQQKNKDALKKSSE